VEHRRSPNVDTIVAGLLKVLTTIADHCPQVKYECGVSAEGGLIEVCRSAAFVCHAFVFLPLLMDLQDLYHNCLFGNPQVMSWPKPPLKLSTRVSRVLGFDLMISLIKDCKPNFAQALKLVAPHHEGKFERVPSWEYHPSSNDKVCFRYLE